MNFADQLAAAVRSKGNACVLGLDPRPDLFPQALKPKTGNAKDIAKQILSFHRTLIDIAAKKIAVVKPQIAFFESYGVPGYECYLETISYAHSKGLLVIGDVKRGDIGSTAEAYAQAHLGKGNECADAITVNPLFGSDGVKPFLDLAKSNNKGIFFLVQTSNPSSSEIQGLALSNGETVSEKIAALVSKWGSELLGSSGYSSAGAVVGATHPKALANLRKKLSQNWLLLPGYGAQGAKASDLAAAFDKNGLGALVSSSRAVLYAYNEKPGNQESSWEKACEKALDRMIEDLRACKS